MTISLIDILFLITVALFVFNGVRNGAVFSLINLASIPIGFVVVFLYGPKLIALLAANRLPSTPFIAYALLFLGTAFALHIVATFIRSLIRSVPVVSFGDALLGGAIGFVESWLLWLILLIILGSFLHGLQAATESTSHLVPGTTVQLNQLKGWHDFYNEAITHSVFARVNGLFVRALPDLPRLPS